MHLFCLVVACEIRYLCLIPNHRDYMENKGKTQNDINCEIAIVVICSIYIYLAMYIVRHLYHWKTYIMSYAVIWYEHLNWIFSLWCSHRVCMGIYTWGVSHIRTLDVGAKLIVVCMICRSSSHIDLENLKIMLRMYFVSTQQH